jgi:hypothetical protein
MQHQTPKFWKAQVIVILEGKNILNNVPMEW